MSDTANKVRGEISVTLEGADYVLRPSFEAISAFEAATGKGLVELAREAIKGDMATAPLAQIVTECMRAQGRATSVDSLAASQTNVVAGLIMEAEGGVMSIMQHVASMLALASTGGYTSSGEVKAAETTTN